MNTTQTNQTIIETVLHYYRFDISKPDQKEQYLALHAELISKGLKVFDGISPNHSQWYGNSIAPLNGKIIQLETAHLFDNQWNTAKTETSDKGLRVFDWSEAIYPNNRNLKEGMYLDQTAEMTEIRNITYQCGYCGKSYVNPSHSFCSCCLGSEYLTEDQLPLLFLTPVSGKKSRKNISIPDSLIEAYREQQQIERTKRLNKKKDAKLTDLQKDITAAEKEYNAFKWLIDHDIDFDNVIYYKHSDTFCFGWRNTLSKETAEKLDAKLHSEGFAALYNIQLKTV